MTDREIVRDEGVSAMPQAPNVAENHVGLKEYTCDVCVPEHGRSHANTVFDSTRSEGKVHIVIDHRLWGHAPNDIRDYWCPICMCRRGYLYFDGMDALKARLKHRQRRNLWCEGAWSVCRGREQEVLESRAKRK